MFLQKFRPRPSGKPATDEDKEKPKVVDATDILKKLDNASADNKAAEGLKAKQKKKVYYDTCSC